MLEKSINRAMKIEDTQNRGNSAMNLNVFDHNNVYYSTRISHSDCTVLSEADFAQIKFYHQTPYLLNDFIYYITAGSVNLHEIYQKQAQKYMYLSKMKPLSPSSKQPHAHLHCNYIFRFISLGLVIVI